MNTSSSYGLPCNWDVWTHNHTKLQKMWSHRHKSKPLCLKGKSVKNIEHLSFTRFEDKCKIESGAERTERSLNATVPACAHTDTMNHYQLANTHLACQGLPEGLIIGCSLLANIVGRSALLIPGPLLHLKRFFDVIMSERSLFSSTQNWTLDTAFHSKRIPFIFDEFLQIDLVNVFKYFSFCKNKLFNKIFLTYYIVFIRMVNPHIGCCACACTYTKYYVFKTWSGADLNVL